MTHPCLHYQINEAWSTPQTLRQLSLQQGRELAAEI